MGLISKKAYKTLSLIMAAVMLVALLGLAAAVDGGLGTLPKAILLGLTAASGGVTVFAAGRGWRNAG